MVQGPFKQRIYSLVVEHTLNPASTPCVGTDKTEEPKKVAVVIHFLQDPKVYTSFQVVFNARLACKGQANPPLNLTQQANVSTISMTRL